MTRKYATAPIHVPDTMPVDPTCVCRFVRCDKGSSYCEVSRLAERAVVSSKAEGAPGLSESDALLQAFDQMAEWNRAEARRRVGGVGSATADTTPSAESVAQAPPVSPRKKRRTKIEMQEFRAAKARQIESSYRELVPASTREWLDEPDPLVDQILGLPHDD